MYRAMEYKEKSATPKNTQQATPALQQTMQRAPLLPDHRSSPSPGSRLHDARAHPETIQAKFLPTLMPTLAVTQLNKVRVANMVRSVRELTTGLEHHEFAIGGSLALQMWHWALNPDSALTRDPGDIDLLLSKRKRSKVIGKKTIDQKEKGLPEAMKERQVAAYPERFYGKQMIEDKYDGFGLDVKLAGQDSRWGAIQSVLMPIEDIAENYALPIQTPEALLYGLLKKYKALEGKTAEQDVVAQDIDVALRLIRQFEAYQHAMR